MNGQAQTEWTGWQHTEDRLPTWQGRAEQTDEIQACMEWGTDECMDNMNKTHRQLYIYISYMIYLSFWSKVKHNRFIFIRKEA